MPTMNFRGPSFTMQVPTNWFITSSPQFQAMFVAPPASDGLRANLAVAITPVSAEVTVQSVAEAARQNQQKEYAEYEMLAEGSFPTNEGPGFQRQYKWYNRERDVHIMQRQVFYVSGQMLYTLTATRQEIGDATEIDQILDQMLLSFKLG